MPSGEHISSRFDSELDEIRSGVLRMAALVRQQAQDAVDAMLSGDMDRLDAVIENDHQVNMMEVKIDEDSAAIVARRQPTARDLRLVMAVSKTVSVLESIGDEIKKIARAGKLLGMKSDLMVPRFHEVVDAAAQVVLTLEHSMQAFADADIQLAVVAMRTDGAGHERFSGVMRHLVACMMEDPRMISRCIAMLDVIKAVERMGDHAHNIAEYVIYMVKGSDVRHHRQEVVERGLL
ncbi:MAG: phosphate signaling complex protein PhoU [Gallionella sp.]|nr:phosphate signaling complex protein PhoU [Gallionella sp.]MDD4947547.1 phosphate signaling complex protein PhoU [Gallionella sp.]MDD5611702.1 phosphate signaling complex protein PhoU [Gallionella sp.]